MSVAICLLALVCASCGHSSHKASPAYAALPQYLKCTLSVGSDLELGRTHFSKDATLMVHDRGYTAKFAVLGSAKNGVSHVRLVLVGPGVRANNDAQGSVSDPARLFTGHMATDAGAVQYSCSQGPLISNAFVP
jgi:hypothetical protein